MNAPIRAQNLKKVYGEAPNETFALNGTSLEIKKGEFVAIIGASGSGKSTLMHILGCLDKPTSGHYYFENKLVSGLSENDLAKIRNEKIGFVFQFFNLLPKTPSIKNVELPLTYASVPALERKRRATEMLEKVGLTDKLYSKPSQLSGGQQQRVAIARALINNPVVIFADEPTGNLDSKSSADIIDIFKKLNREGKTIVMITHEADIAKEARRIITIKDGQIISDRKVKR